MTSPGSTWRRVLTVLLLVAAFGFLVHSAASNWRDLRGFHWRADGWLLLASIVAHVAVLAWGVGVWGWVLRRFEVETIAYPALLRIWSLSNATRYIPGTVWQFIAAAHLSRGTGLPGGVALTSMLVHVAVSLLSSFTVAAATLPLQQLHPGALTRPVLVVLTLGAAAAAVHPAVINLGLKLLARVTRRPTLTWRGSWWEGLTLLLLANVSWLLYGGAYYLFVRSLAPIPPAVLPHLAGINALSFAAGYLVVLAPGGLGVRESAMTVLLSPILPAGVSALVAIAARLWSIVAEVALVAGSAVLFARSRRVSRL